MVLPALSRGAHTGTGTRSNVQRSKTKKKSVMSRTGIGERRGYDFMAHTRQFTSS